MRRAGDFGRVTEFLGFVLSGDTYAVPIHYVAEILRVGTVTPVPRSPHKVIGIMSVRGTLVTVVDLRRHMRLVEGPIDARSRILLVDGGGDEQVGVLVDEVLQVYRLGEGQIEPSSALGGDQPPHIAGIGRVDGTFLVLLDFRHVVGT
ncbi:MAG: chemotaxis protein CheW [Polyangiaceae bacterium]